MKQYPIDKAQILSASKVTGIARVECPYCQSRHTIECKSMTVPWNNECDRCKKIYEVDIGYLMDKINWCIIFKPDNNEEEEKN